MLKRILTNRWFFPVAGLLLGLIAIFLLWQIIQPHQFAGTLIQSPQPVSDFTLSGPQGSQVRLSNYRGKVILLFFGYTSCPDICPTTMRDLSIALDLLGRRSTQVQVILISVDPEKDTPQRLQAYLQLIDPRLLGLTGTPDQILQIATQYGVYFEKRPFGDSGAYLVDHTSTTFLIDPQGYLKIVYPYGTSPQSLASDITYILTH